MPDHDSRPTLRLHDDDNVVVALQDLSPGTALGEGGLTVRDPVPRGHKVAAAPLAAGAAVRKYAQIIGFASQAIAPGDHVHSHNLEFRRFARDHEPGSDARPPDFFPEDRRAFFQGIVRPDGRIATRNHIGILTSVNCAATVARLIADRARSGNLLAAYPHIDGIVPLTHATGCGMAGDGDGIGNLRRTLAGYARHPNFAGVLIVGLGCETNQIAGLVEAEGLKRDGRLQTMVMQQEGGTARTVAAGLERIRAMLPAASDITRQPVPASHLVLALQCGGSDAWSGITANPALGAAADLLIRHGGTAILSETPEIYGAEHLLTRRAASRAVAEKLLDRIRWWEAHTAAHHGSMDNNPSPGNKAGGLTTILEKSLGAAAKGGTTRLVDVYRYGEPVTRRGFVFMDSPGYDPASVTGQIAGGANICCFTTGRGSCFGARPVPSLKLATNTGMYRRMQDDMDINCGPVLDDREDVATMGARIFDLILRTASGEKSKSEILGYGNDEFVPWVPGAVM